MHSMQHFRKNRYLNWIAIVAIFYISLVPLLSHAANESSELGQYDVICSSTGIKLINTNDANDANDASELYSNSHCSYCSLSNTNIISYNHIIISC